MMPAVMAAGSAGGTQIVMTSNERNRTCSVSSPRKYCFKVTTKPRDENVMSYSM